MELNFKEEIQNTMDAGNIIAIRIATTNLEFANIIAHKQVPIEKLDVLLSWEEAAPLLDYLYDDGYGSQECHDVYIWTSASVWFIHEYDGCTGLTSVPRNPI